jgi:hypothetical protein
MAFGVRSAVFQLAFPSLLTALLILGGCRGCHRVAKVSLPNAEDAGKPPLAKSGSVDIHFYLDTTQSMRGYLSQPEGRKNYFNEILDKPTGILREGWTNAAMHFWGFGTDKIERIDFRKYLGNPEAFTGKKTYIDRAIQHDPPMPKSASQQPVYNLKIILTDLFQEGNDLDHLSDLLSDQLKDADRAVGILGLRNPFEGEIDDLPGKQKLPQGAADSLPFYLIIVGQTGDVKEAMSELTRRLDAAKLPADQKLSLLFAQRQVDQLNQKLTVKPATNRPGYTLEDNRVPQAEQQGIPYLAGVRGDLHLIGEELPKPGSPTPGPHMRIAQPPLVKAFMWNNGWTPAPQQAAALAVKSDGAMDLDHSRLMKDSVYLFEIDYSAEPTDFSDLGAWYIELKDIPRLMRNEEFPKAGDGTRPGKTPNLRHFLQTLSDRMFQTNIPLARYYFYVQSE